MRVSMKSVSIFTVALSAALATAAGAQSTAAQRSDARWYAWLGCWASVSQAATTAAAVTCVVPVAGSRDVDVLGFAQDRIISRERLDGSGAPQRVDEAGCRGSEAVAWAPMAEGRRAYVRSEYSCATGARGHTTTLFAFAPNGDWLRISEVASAGGAIVSADRLREVPAPAALPAASSRAIEPLRLAIATARAAAAAPVTVDAVIDAARALDSGVVRAWLAAAGQRFNINAEQAATLARANLSPSIVQAMLGSAQADREGPRTAAGQDVFTAPPAYTGAVAGAPAGYAPAYAPAAAYQCLPNECPAPYPYVYEFYPPVVYPFSFIRERHPFERLRERGEQRPMVGITAPAAGSVVTRPTSPPGTHGRRP